jgi:tRNA-dihydrouridine synthase 2
MHKPIPSNLVFRTVPHLEKPKLIFQLGTNDATTALKAAQVVLQDVSVIDINMGCPKKFSTQMGAGAELLKQPERIRDIVTTLVRNLPIPVTCKIRVMPDQKDTLEIVKIIENAGASALAVHVRTDTMSSSKPAMWDQFRPIIESASIPIIACGDMWRRSDFERVKEIGCTSALYARGALLNPSLFRPEGYLPIYTVMRDYANLCHR